MLSLISQTVITPDGVIAKKKNKNPSVIVLFLEKGTHHFVRPGFEKPTEARGDFKQPLNQCSTPETSEQPFKGFPCDCCFLLVAVPPSVSLLNRFLES